MEAHTHPGRTRSAREPIAAGHGESNKVVELRDALHRRRPSTQERAYLQSPDGQKTEIPASIFDVLARVADDMAHGHAIMIVPVGHELTTQEAADILNVSRPHLVKLLESGEIDFHLAGTHRRVYFEHLMAYRERRDRGRHEVLDELARESAEAAGGLEY
jgi:excisionase family DNA binding protein